MEMVLQKGFVEMRDDEALLVDGGIDWNGVGLAISAGAGGFIGKSVGSKIGAAIGTAVAPGAGSVIGGIVGAGVATIIYTFFD